MSKADNKNIYIPCDCGCCVLEVSKWVWDDDDCGYDICVLDSRYDHDANGIWNRIKRAAKALLGKPVYFNDVSLTQDSYEELLRKMSDLRDSEGDAI